MTSNDELALITKYLYNYHICNFSYAKYCHEFCIQNSIFLSPGLTGPSLPLAIVLRHILSSARTCSPTADALYPLQSSLELV